MTLLKDQYNLILIALSFLTRIPVPTSVDFSQQKLNQASRYFPLIGWFIGGLCALIYWLLALYLPNAIAIILSMLASILITGCFHEDGLADTCDGFGGGWEKEQKLAIMKDSRIGTYGAAALWFAFSLKFILLSHVDNVVVALIVAHALSRSVSTCLISLLPYVAEFDLSKVKPLTESQNKIDLRVSLITGGATLLLVPASAIALVITLIVAVWIIRKYLRNQIGGFTGDTLGATQQVTELLIYLILIAGSTSS